MKEIVHLAAVVALTTGVAACGTQAFGQPGGQPTAVATMAARARVVTARPQGVASASPQGVASRRSPVPPRILTGQVTLTVADNGAAVRLRVGQRASVVLASGGMFSWPVPTAVGAAVRRVSASGGYPGQRPARAAFLAVQAGSATLAAVDDIACLHAQPACEPAQQEWRVTVLVTGG